MSISRNAAYNALGAALPSVLTLVTVPLYLNFVGIERYGMLTLCWVILGYSGFLDVGLSLAVVRKVAATAERSGTEGSDIFWTSIWISLVMGLVSGALIYIGGSLYFDSMANTSLEFQEEVGTAVPLLAASIPILSLGGVLSGALQGRERFLQLNLSASVSHTLLAVLPLVVAYFWTSHLTALVASALFARMIPFPWLFWLCRSAIPLGPPKGPSRSLIRELVSFGGWVSLTVIANTVIQTMDRLVIGRTIGPAGVPPYAIPYGLVSRIILVPHSLSAALFPRFANADEEDRKHLTTNSILAVAVITTPLSIGLIAVSEPFFRLWVGASLAATATPIAYILAGGFWIYCIGHMAYSMLQATGRPAIVSKLLLAELIPYGAALLFGIWMFGVIGAAAAFTLRAIVDCLIFLRLARVPSATLFRLVIPASLVAAAVATAPALTGPAEYFVFGVLLVASIIWSAFNIPEVLRPYLGKLVTWIPVRRGGEEAR